MVWANYMSPKNPISLNPQNGCSCMRIFTVIQKWFTIHEPGNQARRPMSSWSSPQTLISLDLVNMQLYCSRARDHCYYCLYIIFFSQSFETFRRASWRQITSLKISYYIPRQNTGTPKTRKAESGIGNSESRNRNPESGIRNPESGLRNQDSGIRNPQIEDNMFFKCGKITLHRFCL